MTMKTELVGDSLKTLGSFDGGARLTVGLLGVQVPPELLEYPQAITGKRLDEIERRILLIEARIAALPDPPKESV